MKVADVNNSSGGDDDSRSPDGHALDKILEEKKEIEIRLGEVNYTLSRGDESVRYSYLLTADNGTATYYELGAGLRLNGAVNGSGEEEVSARQETINAIVNKMIFLNPDY